MARRSSKDIEEEVQRLLNTPYQAPARQKRDFVGAANLYKRDYSKLSTSNYDNYFGSVKDEKPKGLTPDFWGMLSGTVSQPVGLITNQLEKAVGGWKNLTDGKGNFGKDLAKFVMSDINPINSLSEGIANGGKEQWKDWTDPNLSWGDFPGIGFLHGMDKGWKRGDDVLNTAGMKAGIGRTIAGLVLDVGLDPVTYATGGLSMGAKAGKVAELGKASEISKALGLGDKVKNSTKFLNLAEDHFSAPLQGLKQSVQNSKISSIARDMKIQAPVHSLDDLLRESENVLKKKYPNSNNVIPNKLKQIQQDVMDAGGAIDRKIQSQVDNIKAELGVANRKAFDANVNTYGMGLPLVNKTLKLGDIGKKSLNYRSEALVPKGTVDNLINQVTNGSSFKTDKITNEILKKYGVAHTGELTKTMFDDLAQRFEPIIAKGGKGLPDAKVTETLLTKEIPNNIYNIKTKRGTANPNLTYTKSTVDDILKSVDPRVASKIEPMLKGWDDVTRITKIRDLGADATKMFGEFAGNIMGKTVKGAKTKAEIEKAFSEAADILHNLKAQPTLAYQELNRVAEIFKNGDNAANQMRKTRDIMDALGIPLHKAQKGIESIKNDSSIASRFKSKDEFNQVLKNYNAEFENLLNKNLKDDAFNAANDALKKKYNLNRVGDSSKPFTESFNGRTNFEHFLDKHNPFDARTLKTGDKLLDSMANHIADASSQRIGDAARYNKSLSDLEKHIKENWNSKTEKQQAMKEAIYHLEKKAPDSLHTWKEVKGKDGKIKRVIDKRWEASDKVKGLADMIKPILDQVASEEQQAGVLSKLRKAYFPHMLNKSADEIKQIMEYKDKHGDLNGLSIGNKNDKSRKSFQTLAERDNYMGKLAKQIVNETNPEAAAKLQEQLTKVADLFDTDVVSALTRRVKEGVRAKAMKDMQTKLSRFEMMVSDPKTIEEKAKAISGGLTKLDAGEAKKLGLKTTKINEKGKEVVIEHYIHPKVLDGMKRVDEIFTNQGMNKGIRHLNAVTDILKSLMTTYKLSHYRNNFVGNTMINMAAGVGIPHYIQAGKLLKGYTTGFAKEIKSGKITQREADGYMKLIKEAYKKNVLSGGFVTDNMVNFHFDDPTKLEKAAHVVGHNKAIRTVRQTAEKGDDVFRLANYLHGLDKYKSSEKAAAQVREYLFNYNELTNADRAIRTVVPFWNWTKRNIPLQAKLLLENPKFAVNTHRFQEFWNKDQQGTDWQKDSGIKIPFTNYYTGIPNPVNDLKNVVEDPTSLLSSMNPILKMIIETNMNKQFYTGKPITYGSDTIAPNDFAAYLAKNLGIGGNIYDGLSGRKSPVESGINYVNPVTAINNNGN